MVRDFSHKWFHCYYSTSFYTLMVNSFQFVSKLLSKFLPQNWIIIITWNSVLWEVPSLIENKSTHKLKCEFSPSMNFNSYLWCKWQILQQVYYVLNLILLVCIRQFIHLQIIMFFGLKGLTHLSLLHSGLSRVYNVLLIC